MQMICLTNSELVTLIDDDDLAVVAPYKWRLHQQGYAWGYIAVFNRSIMLHRWIMGTPIGRVPEYDHENRDKLDNQKRNLIIKTRSGNMFNTLNETKGVYLLPSGRWRAMIRRDYNLIHLGVFDTEAQAREARIQALSKGEERLC